MARRIYLASSWRNPMQPAIVHFLRESGHEVYDFRNPPGGRSGFGWHEIDPEWQRWTVAQYVAALDHPRAVEGFESDRGGMVWADTGVLLLPCGRSAHLEAGWFAGRGVPLAILTCEGQEPELMAKFAGLITGNVNELDRWLGELGPPIGQARNAYDVRGGGW